MTKGKSSLWFQSSKNATYLSWNENSYLSVAKDEILESRQLLESVLAKTETEEQKIRAQQLLYQFEYYEASALSYPSKLAMPTTEEQALDFLDELEDTLESRLELVKRPYELVEEYKNTLALRYPADPFERRGSWSGWNAYEFWNLIQYIEQNEPSGGAITNKVNSFAQYYEKPKLRQFARLLQFVDPDSSLVKNPTFEAGNTTPTSWNIWNPENSAQIKRVSNEEFYSGNSSMRFENTKTGGVYQTVPVKPGLLASSVRFYTPEDTASNGTIQIVIELYNTAGEKQVYRSNGDVFADTAGTWATVGFLEQLPEQINGKDIVNMLINAQVRNAQDTIVYLDDLVVYQVQYGAADLIDFINRYVNEGKLTEEQTQSMIGLLEAAEEKFQRNEIEPYIGLIVDFIAEVELLRSDEVLSEADYQPIVNEAYALIRQQIDFQLSSEEFKTTHPGTYSIPVTIKNNHSADLSFELSGSATDGIQLNFDNPFIVPAKQSLTVEGTLIVPEALEEDDYLVDIRLGLGGKNVLHTKLNMAHYTNLLKNPGFEEVDPADPPNVMYWFNSINVRERSNEEVHGGSYALKMMPDPSVQREIRSDNVAIIPGAKYRLSGWVYSENSKAQFGLRQTNQSSASLQYDFTEVSHSDAGWQYFELELTPRSDATIFQVYLRILKGAGAPVWFDDMKLEVIAIP